MDTKFTFYLSLSNGFLEPLSRIQRGTSYPAVRDSDVFVRRIQLPPLPEQRRIVAKIEALFTKLDAGVEALKRVQTLLKRYRQSVLKAAVEGKLTEKWREAHKDEIEPASELLKRILAERRAKWEETELAKMKAKGKVPKDDRWKERYSEPLLPNLSDEHPIPTAWMWVTSGGICDSVVPNRDKPKSFSGGTPWITLPDFHDARIELVVKPDQIGLSEEEVRAYRAKVIPKGSVVMSCVGRFGIASVLPTPVVINQQLHAFLVPSTGLRPEYLAIALKSQRRFMEKAATATTISYLNKTGCNSVPIPLPGFKEQAAIVSEVAWILSVVDKWEGLVEMELSRSKAMRQSILKKAFEGKLVPQDPNDEPASVLLERITAQKNRGTTKDLPFNV